MTTLAAPEFGATALPEVDRRAADRRWDLTVVCAAAYWFASVGRIHQLFPVLEPLKPALLSALAVLFFSLLDARRLEWIWAAVRSPAGICLVGLMLWTALSVPGALNIGHSLDTFSGFIKAAVMCFAVAGVARGPRDAERLALMYFLAVTLYAYIVLLRFHVGSDVSRLGVLYYYDANDFAVLAVTAVPPGLHFVMTSRPYWQRIAGIVGIPALITTIVWSGSRGGFLALLVVTALVLLGAGTIPWRWRLAAMGALVIGITVSASDGYWTRMMTIIHPDNDYNETSDSGRLNVWKRGLVYAADHPILGVGAGDFPVAEGTLSPLADRQTWGVGVKWSEAHNTFVQVAAELGIPGFACFIGMMWAGIRALGAVRRGRTGVAYSQGERSARLAGTLQISIAGLAAGGFFLSLAYREMIYALIALAISLHRVAGPITARRRHQWA